MLTHKAFDDRENKQINMVESFHKVKYMFPWGLGGDPPQVSLGMNQLSNLPVYE